jgi:hypothetical protein
MVYHFHPVCVQGTEPPTSRHHYVWFNPFVCKMVFNSFD